MRNPKVQGFHEIWQHKLKWFERYLSALTDEELKTAPAQDMNHGVWMLAHLLSDEDNLAKYLGKGRILYPDYQERFAPQQQVPPVRDCPPPADLRQQRQEVTAKNEKIFQQLTDAELEEPHALFEPSPDRPVESKQLCIMNRILHVAHHCGQLALLLRKHGKNVF